MSVQHRSNPAGLGANGYKVYNYAAGVAIVLVVRARVCR